jgi:glucose-1-phosphate adenylyltransferase
VVQGSNLVSSGLVIDNAQVVNSVLSPRIHIARGAEVEECILLPGAEVGENARLRRAIVEEGVRVPPGAVIGFGLGSPELTVSPGDVAVVWDRRGASPPLVGERPPLEPLPGEPVRALSEYS